MVAASMGHKSETDYLPENHFVLYLPRFFSVLESVCDAARRPVGKASLELTWFDPRKDAPRGCDRPDFKPRYFCRLPEAAFFLPCGRLATARDLGCRKAGRRSSRVLLA